MITPVKTHCQIGVLIALAEGEVCVGGPCLKSTCNWSRGLSWGALKKGIGEVILRGRPFWVSPEESIMSNCVSSVVMVVRVPLFA